MNLDLSEYAIRLAQHVAHVSENGLTDPIKWSVVAERFTPADRPHMVEAAYELKLAGLLRIAEGMNVPDGISHIRAEYPLYWNFDGDVFNYDTASDVATLIRLILEDELRGNATILSKCLDWTPRRFNPAFARIVDVMPSQRVSQEVQREFPATGISVMPEDRVVLRQLLAEMESAAVDAAESQKSIEEKPEEERRLTGSMRIKLPLVEADVPTRPWAIWSVVILALVVTLVWQWPKIEERFPQLSTGPEYVLQDWRVDAGKDSTATLRVPPNSDRARDIEVYVRYAVSHERPGDPWHRLVVKLNGDVVRDSGQMGTRPGPENVLEFRLVEPLPANATLDIRAEVSNYFTRSENLMIEATELH